MTDRFVITENGIEHNTRTIDFERITSYLGRETKILPRGCIYEDDYNYIVELEPKIRLLRTQYQRVSLGYKLAFPWQYFLIKMGGRGFYNNPHIQDIFLFWAKDKFTSFNTRLIPAAIPNVYNGRVCLGSTVPDSMLPVHERINEITSQMFTSNSRFTEDYGWQSPFKYQRGTMATIYRAWQADSKDNPECYKQWEEFAYPSVTLYDYVSIRANEIDLYSLLSSL